MFKSEYAANQAGFTCCPMQARKEITRDSKGLGFNVFKAMGYVVTLLALLAVVFN